MKVDGEVLTVLCVGGGGVAGQREKMRQRMEETNHRVRNSSCPPLPPFSPPFRSTWVVREREVTCGGVCGWQERVELSGLATEAEQEAFVRARYKPSSRIPAELA